MVGTLFKAFPQIQHLVTAGLEAAIFAVSGLGVEDLAAVFTLDSAHAGVTINEIFHQNILIFTFHCSVVIGILLWLLRICAGYQNGNHHFYTIKRYDCLVGDQNDHQLNLLCYG